ncbi:MAG: CoA ester lyase, partial [Burkholderiaceae bacterium]|nr:CoA ester lyase [Burkholderiaceae bacterium]
MHPSQALFEEGPAAPSLPVVDHYCGVEARMKKSLELQAQMGPVFDITLDCEDGAPIGGEAEHIELVLQMLASPDNRFGRVGVRVHAPSQATFEADIDALVARAGERMAYLMVPKPRDAAELNRACDFIDASLARHGIQHALPVH